MSKEIKTPWGKIVPEVSLFPIYYLIIIYGFVYILPFGRDFIGISWFDWLRNEDGPLEWTQFIEYSLSSLFAFVLELGLLLLLEKGKASASPTSSVFFSGL